MQSQGPLTNPTFMKIIMFSIVYTSIHIPYHMVTTAARVFCFRMCERSVIACMCVGVLYVCEWGSTWLYMMCRNAMPAVCFSPNCICPRLPALFPFNLWILPYFFAALVCNPLGDLIIKISEMILCSWLDPCPCSLVHIPNNTYAIYQRGWNKYSKNLSVKHNTTQ